LDDRGYNSVAYSDIRSFSARFTQGKDAGGSSAEIDEHLISAHGGHEALDDLAGTKRPELAAVEELFHRLGFALGGPYPLIDCHTRLGAHHMPSV
jgi:hypothetical protein